LSGQVGGTHHLDVVTGRFTVAALSLAVATAACIGPFDDNGPCALVGFPAVAVVIRDDFGRPAAIGAKLVVRDGDFADSAVGEYDPLRLGTADNRAGKYAVRVSRPWYGDVAVQNVKVSGDHCGAKATVFVPVTLHLVANAPPVRSVAVIPPRAYYSLGGLILDYQAYVDANPGIDTGVTWTIDDTLYATLTPTGRLVTKCLNPNSGDVVVAATSNVDSTVRGHGYMRVGYDYRGC
jgi:hypothetical protein